MSTDTYNNILVDPRFNYIRGLGNAICNIFPEMGDWRVHPQILANYMDTYYVHDE